jgi:hypothetical protein
MVIKYTNNFHSKTIQNLPKLGFLVWKQTIWQPWSWEWISTVCRVVFFDIKKSWHYIASFLHHIAGKARPISPIVPPKSLKNWMLPSDFKLLVVQTDQTGFLPKIFRQGRRGTRCDCEKIAQSVAQPNFCQTWRMSFTVGKVAQILSYFCNFKNTALRKKITQ